MAAEIKNAIDHKSGVVLYEMYAHRIPISVG